MNVNIYRGDLLCCRVCLATDIKLISLDQRLKETYFEFSGLPIKDDDGLPQHICVFCWALLKKSLDFRQNCRATYTLLASHLLDIHGLTTSYIEKLDRSNLRPSLYITNVLQFNCIPDEIICISDEETADHDDSFGNRDSKAETQTLDDVKNNFINIFDHKIEIQDNSPCITEKILNEDEDRIDDFKNKHFNTIMNTDKELFYYYILEKYLTKSKEKCNDSTISIIGVTDNIIDSVEHPIINTENVNETCKTIQNESQKRLYEYINSNYIKKNTSQVKPKKPKDLLRNIKNKKIRKGKQTTQSLAKFSRDYNVDVKLMLKEDNIKELLKRKESNKYKNAEFKCELCFTGFATEQAFQNHKAMHDPSLPYVCEFCRLRFYTSRAHRKHLGKSHRYKFVCRQCGHTTKSITVAREHHRNHFGGDNYLCEHCGQTFNKYASRIAHIRIKHGSVPCDICHMLFATERGLATHKPRAHKELFKCGVCLVQFHNATALRRHADLTETETCGKHIRPCTRCGGSFDSEESLKLHVLDAHPAHKSTLNRAPSRRRRGDQLTCEQHMAVHIDRRPFPCPHPNCSKAFKWRQNLTLHSLAHSTVKKFSCDTCQKSYKYPHSLSLHKQIVHEDKPRPRRR